MVVSTPLVLAERKRGMKWRREREERLKKKKQQYIEAPAAEAEAEHNLEVIRSWSQGTSDHVHH